MTRSKTFGSKQVESQVDSILENLVESTHPIFALTHLPFSFELCCHGSEQVESQVGPILGNSVWVDSPTPYVDSFPIFLWTISPRVRTGRVVGQLIPGINYVWVDSSLIWFDSLLVLHNFMQKDKSGLTLGQDAHEAWLQGCENWTFGLKHEPLSWVWPRLTSVPKWNP